MNLSERLNTPISTAELERRWSAVRAAMEAEKIDVLLMQNNNDHMGGYVKYFTDLPATNGYPMTVVFPRDDGMTIVDQGPFGMVKELPKAGDGVRRGVKTWMTTPSFASAHYTAAYDPELAGKALAPYAGGTVGLVGTYQMSLALVDHLRNGRFSNSKFVDASDLVDRIKVIKSPEEMELIKRTARMQDGAMRAAFAAVEPGMREADITAVAECYSRRHGGENGIYLCASGPIGTPCLINQRHYQNRVIRDGDYVMLLVEDSGPGAITPSSAAPAWSARCRSRCGTSSRSRLRPAASPSTCSSPGRPARRSGTSITPSCAGTADPRKRGSIATVKATIWSSVRSCAATSPWRSPRA